MAFTLNAVVARNADGFQIGYTSSDGAGLTLTVEMNRSPDFSSDDTLIATFTGVGNGTGNIFIYGLPHDTPFWVRARTNAAGAVYSNSVLVATLTLAQTLAYAGFSHDKAALVVPAPISGLTAGTGGGASLLRPGFPVSNLLLDDPQATFQTYGTDGQAAAVLNFSTSGEPLDTLAILGTLINDAATWRIQTTPTSGDFTVAGNTDSGTIAMRCSPTLGRRSYYHALYSSPTPTQNMFWRVTIRGTAAHFIARGLVVGLARASVNASMGYGFEANDMGSAQRTRFGGLDRVFGWRGRTIDFAMSWLSEAEFQTKWAGLPQLIGKQTSVLTIVNSKRNTWLNDRIGYGPLTAIRGENMRSSKMQQSVSQDSLY